MTNAELLAKVKEGNNIYGDYLDFTIQLYIDEVKHYMMDAGVSEGFFSSDACVGIVTIGVKDLYINGSLSTYFHQRVNQLKYEVKANV